MRLRFTVLASLLGMLAAVSLPAAANAAPHHNRGLTINVTPNPILAGEGVLIYGQLNGGQNADEKVALYHHISGTGPGFSRIGITTTDAHGFYEFTRAEGVVETNRSWFVKEMGVHGIHSRTTHERVGALVSLTADTTTASTRKPVLFSGHVDPNHRFERVYLQKQVGSGDKWKTLTAGRLGPASNYQILRRFRFPGEYVLRTVFRGDHRNIKGVSDPVTVTVQQAEKPDFTIASSDPIVPIGQSATISGVLYQPGTTTPEPGTPVTLCSRAVFDGAAFTCDTAGITGVDGSYSFSVSPVHNEVYFVETTLAPHRQSASLLEGVQDTVTLSASSSTVQAGQSVTLSGTVTPDHTGGVAYLERLGADGAWHVIAAREVTTGSQFTFTRVPGTPGTRQFRVRIPGGPDNIGAVSPTVTVTVTLPPVSSLPTS